MKIEKSNVEEGKTFETIFTLTANDVPRIIDNNKTVNVNFIIFFLVFESNQKKKKSMMMMVLKKSNFLSSLDNQKQKNKKKWSKDQQIIS